ncbi:MAG TPA: DUF5667 domain-containing protein [Chloroflexota bacterium]
MAKPEDILEQVLLGELTREEAIAQQPEMEDRLLLVTSLAGQLRDLPRQQPNPEFRHRARLRLLQHVQQTPPRRLWWQTPFAGLSGWASRVAAVIIAGGGLTFGVSYASASALPDDGLYPVKRAVEQVQLAISTSDEAKANTYLDLADRRAAEMSATAGELDDRKLQGLAADYGQALQNVTSVVQALPAPPPSLLDKVQTHVASQATEIEARALNSGSRPAVQRQLAQAEVVASNTVDHVVLVAEKSGKPGPQDIRLAANAPAVASVAAATSAVPSTPPAPSAAAPAKAAVAAAEPAASSLDGEFDQLWNQVAAASFMAQRVRTLLETDVANAKQDTHTGRMDAATADMNAFVTQLQAAAANHQATEYTATHLITEAKAILAALPRSGSNQLGLRVVH